MRVLLIEDDRVMGDAIRDGLSQAGHDVELARTGAIGIGHAMSGSFDVIVTDWMLPPPDGLQIVRALRSTGIATPILMLTALHQSSAQVEGLEAGADDYLAKPFELSVLRARLNALARRPAARSEPNLLRFRDVEMDVENGTVRRAGRPIELKPAELKLLRYMLRHPGELLTKAVLLEQVFRQPLGTDANLVEQQVSRLRRKLDAGHEADPLIHTIRNSGYRLGPG